MVYASKEGGYGAGASVFRLDASHPDYVLVPDGDLLFTGDFKRHGSDLVLTGHDGRRHIVPGYFAGEKHPALVAPNGASLSANLIDLLTGSPAPGQYAQAGQTSPADAIGKVEKVVGNVVVVRNGVAVTLSVGDAVYKNDVVQTGTNSACGISFPDGTALNLVANTRMALNDFSYDANGNSNDALFTLVQGTFAFVAGKVAHTGDMKIETPVATMGIRGTTGFVQEQIGTITANVGNVTYSFAVVEDYGTGRVGQYELVDAQGNVIATVSQNGYLTFVTPQGPALPPLVTTQPMTNSQIGFQQQIIQQVFQVLNSGNNPNPQSNPGSNGSSTPPPNQLHLPQLLQNNPSGNSNSLTFNLSGSGSSGSSSTSTSTSNTTVATPVVTWVGPFGGNWNNPYYWSDGVIPLSWETVQVISGEATLSGAAVIGGLVIEANGIVNVVGGGALTLSNSIEIDRGGALQLNSVVDPTLSISGTVKLSGGGAILLAGSGANNILAAGSGATLNNVRNTIAGTGTIGLGDGHRTLVNGIHGTIEATALVAGDTGLLAINTGNLIDNSGVMEATSSAGGSGTLHIEDSVKNEVSGLIEAFGGGKVTISSASVDNFGGIASYDGTVSFLNVIVTNESGGVIGTSSSSAYVNFTDGTVVNSGVIATNGGAVTFTDSTVTNNTLVDLANGSPGINAAGSGSISFDGGSVTNNGLIVAQDNSQVVFKNGQVDNTVGSAALLQAGFVEGIAAFDSGTVTFNGAQVTNTGLIAATVGTANTGGTVNFDNTTVDNSGGFIAADNSVAASTSVLVNLSNSTIEGGTLTTSGPGSSGSNIIVEAVTTAGDPNISVFDGTTEGALTVSGYVGVFQGAQLELKGAINIDGANGEIDVGGPSGGATGPANLVIDGTVTLTTDGANTTSASVSLDATATHAVQIIAASGGGTLDNDVTIAGSGNIGADNPLFMLTNEQDGTINAVGTTALVIDNDSPASNNFALNEIINSGIIEANGTGGLTIENTTIDNSTFDPNINTGVDGHIVANSLIDLGDATILQGFVTINSGAHLTTVAGSANEIETANGPSHNNNIATIVNDGTITVTDDSSLTLASPDAIDNIGAITLSSTGDTTTLFIDQGFAGINGGGNITLSNSTENFISVKTSGDQLTNFDNTISGAGTIGGGGMVLVNAGTIDATGTNPLVIDAGGTPTAPTDASLTNTGTLEATGSATLVISSPTVDNANGTISAVGAHSWVQLSGTAIIGGTINGAGTLEATADGGVKSSISGVAAGDFTVTNVTIDAGATLVLDNDSVGNATSATIFNDTASGAVISVDAGDSLTLTNVTIDGGAAVVSGAIVYGGALDIASGATLNLYDTQIVGVKLSDLGAINVYDNSTIDGFGSVFTGTTNIAAGKTLTLNNALVTGNVEGVDAVGGPHPVAASLIDVTGASEITGNDTVSDGKLTVESGVTLTLDNVNLSGVSVTGIDATSIITIDGTVTLSDATIAGGTVDDTSTASGIVVTASSEIDNAIIDGGGDITVTSGTLTLASDTLDNVTLSGTVTGSGTLTIDDQLTLDGAQITDGTLDIATSGSIVVSADSSISDATVENGEVSVTSGTLTLASDTLDNVTLSGTVTGSGTLTIDDQLTLDGAQITDGTLDIATSGSIVVSADSSISDATVENGEVSVTSGTLTLASDTLDNVTLSGTVTGSGTLTIDDQLTLDGAQITDGTLDIATSGSIVVSADSSISDATVENGEVSVTSGTLTLASDTLDNVTLSGTVTGSGTLTIDDQLTLDGAQITDGTLDIATSGSIVVSADSSISDATVENGEVSVTSGTLTLASDTLDNVTLSGTVTGSGTLTIDDQLTLDGAQITDGTLDIATSGSIVVSADSSISDATVENGEVSVTSGTLTLASDTLDNVTLSGTVTGSGTLTIDDQLTLNGAQITDGTLDIATSGSIVVSADSSISDATVENGEVSVTSGTLTLASDTLDNVTLSGTVTGSGTLTIDDQLTLNGAQITDGTLDIATSGSIVVSADSSISDATVENGEVSVTSGTLTLASDTLDNVTLSGTVTGSGTLTIDDQLTLDGAQITDGTLDIATSGSIVVSADSSISDATVENGEVSVTSGTLTLASDTLDNVTLSGTVTGSGTLTIDDQLTLDGAQITDGTLDIATSGSIVVSADSSISDATVENGEVSVTSGTLTLASDTLDNVTLSGTVTGSGTLTIDDQLTLDGAQITDGTLDIATSGSIVVSADSSISDATVENGEVSVTSGTLTLASDTLDNVTLSGTVTGSGTLTIDDQLTLDGAQITDGTLDIATSGSIVVSADSSISDATVENGEVSVTSGTLTLASDTLDNVTLSGTVTGSGTLTIDDQLTLDGAQITDGTLDIATSGSIVVSADSSISDATVENGEVSVTSGTLTLASDTLDNVTLSGTVTGSGTLTIDDQLTLDGAQITDGTLDIATSGSIVVSADSSISDATVENGEVSVTSGTLTLASDTLDNVTLSGTVTGSGTLTIDDQLTLNGAQITDGTLDIATSGSIVVSADSSISDATVENGEVSVTSGTLTLASDTLDNVTLSGTVTGSGTLTIDDQLTLNGAQITDGTLDIATSGSIVVSADSSISDATVENGEVSVTSGTLTLASDTLDNVTLSGTVTGSGTLTIDDQLTLNGAQITDGTLDIATSGSIVVSADSSISDATVENGEVSVTSGTLTLASDTLDNVTLSGTVTGSGTLTIDDQLTLDGAQITDGTLDIATSGSIVVSADSSISDATVENGEVSVTSGTLTFDANTISGTMVTISGGGITLDGTEKLEGGTTVSGGIVTNAGTLEVVDTATLSGTTISGSIVQVDGGATLTLDGATINGSTVDDKGTVLVGSTDAAASISVDTLTVESGAFIKADGGSLTITENASGSSNAGTIEALDGGTLTINHANGSDSTNSGTIEADDATVNLNDDSANSNTGTGLVEAVDGGTININLVSSAGSGGGNSGTIEADGGTVVITGEFAGAVMDNAGGDIEALASGSTVQLAELGIVGGTLTTDDPSTGTGGSIEIATPSTGTNTVAFNGLSGAHGALTVDAYVDVQSDATLALLGTINVGTAGTNGSGGTIDIAGSTDANLAINGTVTLQGPGSVILGGSGDAITGVGGTTPTLDNFITISGAGSIGGHGLTLDNENGGVIDATGTSPLTINTGANTITNAGTLEASDLSTLHIESAVTNSGTINVDDGGTVELDGITIANTNTIEVNAATGSGVSPSPTYLEIAGTVTLQGGPGNATGAGTVTLTDSYNNFIDSNGSAAELINADNTISGAGTIGDQHLTLDNEQYGVIDATGTNPLILDTGTNTITNSGTLEATNGGTLEINSSVDNAGAIAANGGTVDVVGAVTDTGTASISNNGILEFQSSVASGQTITFDDATGTLAIGDTADFHATIAGFGANGAGNTIDLTGIAYSSSETDIWNANTDTLTISNGTQTASIHLSGGSYSQDSFALTSDGALTNPGTDIVWSAAQNASVSGLDNADNTVIGSAVTANLNDATATNVTYTWLENGQVVSGQTTDSYTATASSEIGDKLDVVIGFTANGGNEQVTELAGTVVAASPTLSTAPGSTAVTLGTTAPTLTDTATLAGGYNETGTITFTLFENGGTSPVDTETVSVHGNGLYTTAAGYTLPTTGTVTGTYQWDATYGGDPDNNTASDIGNSAEQVAVGAASPALTTAAGSTAVTLGTTAPTLSDAAVLSGGYFETGTITFKLYYDGGTTAVDTETVSVNGNGTYTTPTGYTSPTTGTVTGTYQWDASYGGDSNNNTASDLNDSAAQVIVSAASPSIATAQQPATAIVGTTVADDATISGGFSPTGTVTFDLYSSATTQNSSTLLFADTISVSGNGTYTSSSYTTTVTGTDYWVATYNGDANNNAVTSGAAAEPVTIIPATPSIETTQQPASVTVGGAVSDTATVDGGFNPTGTVTFDLYNNPNGTGTAMFTDTETLASGTATSASYTATATGTDYWVATYNGDSNNNSVSSGSAAEPATITPATPGLATTQEPASATVGTAISDTATVSGGFNPTGTVTFALYNNSSGTGTPLFTDTETLASGTATSASYTATATGTDYWVATYNGDANNNAVTSGAAAEPATIIPATPGIATAQQPASVTVGEAIADQATVSGGFNPTGTVTFDLYSSATTQNSSTLLFTDTEALASGTATSASYTTAATGADYWVAIYNGDSNNNTVTSGATAEPVTVGPAEPFTWATNASGDWADPTSWNNSGYYPGQFSNGDDVNITPSGSIVVTYDATETINSLTTNGDTTLDIHSGSLTITSDTAQLLGQVEIASGGTLQLTDGSVDLVTNAGNFDVVGDNSVLLIGGSLDNDGGTIAISNNTGSGTSSIELGNITITSGNLNIGSATDALDALTVDGGDSATLDNVAVTNDGNINVGVSNAASVLTLEGTTAISGSGSVVNDGSIVIASGSVDIGEAVTGSGNLQINGGATLELGSTSTNGVTFESTGAPYGVLVLDDPAGFGGQITGFTGTAADTSHSDEIVLQTFDPVSLTESVNYSGGITTLTVSDSSNPSLTDTLYFVGDYTNNNTTNDFKLVQNGNNLEIFDPPATSTSTPSVSVGRDQFVFHQESQAGGAGTQHDVFENVRFTAAQAEQWSALTAATSENDALFDAVHQNHAGATALWHHEVQNATHLH